MATLDLAGVTAAVRRNCHLSDALHAGDLTMCTFLLRMRELYRWEHGLPLTREMPRAAVGEWMNQRSQLWDSLESSQYEAIPLPDGAVDPFESRRINDQLLRTGHVYSGGYGRHCKPHFFLAELREHEQRDGMQIYVSGRELARDLDAPPGMLLDRSIFVRTEALRRWLWERFEEWRWNRKNDAMGRAVAHYPFAEAPEAALDAMTEAEKEAVILHELGEARAGAELGDAWETLLLEIARDRAEIMARAVRDLYADCLVVLPGLLEREDPARIHFYFANYVGMRRKLHPELAQAYEAWAAGGALQPLQAEASAGRARWGALCHELLALHARHDGGTAAAVTALLDRQGAC